MVLRIGEGVDRLGGGVGIAGGAKAREQGIAGFDHRLGAGRDARVDRGEQRVEFLARRLVRRPAEIVDAGGRVDEQRTDGHAHAASERLDAFGPRFDLGLVVPFRLEQRRDDRSGAIGLAASLEQGLGLRFLAQQATKLVA